MRCDKCKSQNIELIKEVKDLILEPYFYQEYYECSRLHFKCSNCGFEFIEGI